MRLLTSTGAVSAALWVYSTEWLSAPTRIRSNWGKDRRNVESYPLGSDQSSNDETNKNR
jgi:hypothetical protein